METVQINKSYPMNVWITSILLAPIISILFLAIQNHIYWNVGFVGLYILFVFGLMIIALPSIFLHMLAFKELVISIRSVMLLKALLSVIAICASAFTYVITERFMNTGYGYDILMQLFCFAGCLLSSSFIYRVKVE